MKVVLTVQLQQDNGTVVFTGTDTKTAFAPDSASIQADVDFVRAFLVGPSMLGLVRMLAWISSGQLPVTGTPTVTIRNL